MAFQLPALKCPVCTATFTPKREHGVYCSDACRKRHHNLQTHLQRKLTREKEKVLKSNRDTLARLFLMEDFKNGISRDALRAAKLDLHTPGIPHLNSKTGKTNICWLEYGIELLDPVTKTYLIRQFKF
jgi:hypothetical protein